MLRAIPTPCKRRKRSRLACKTSFVRANVKQISAAYTTTEKLRLAKMRAPLGQYTVGVHDAHLPDSLGGHRVRLFYPAESNRSAARGQARWFPRSLGSGLADETALGIMRFLKAPFPWLFALMVSPLASSSLNALLDAPILSSPDQERESANVSEGQEPAPRRLWPVVLFSHGLGGSIAAYSVTCIDIASHGYVVGAIEHSEGSSMNAFVGSTRRNMPFLFYNGPETDGPEFDFRNRQLETRLEDLNALLRGLQSAASSEGENFVPLEGHERSSGPDLRNLLDFNNLHVAGHSYVHFLIQR